MMKRLKLSLLAASLLSLGLVGCNDDDKNTTTTQPPTPIEVTPASIELEHIGRYESGVYEESAAEITAFDPASKRIFVVNAKKGVVDVLDGSQLNAPKHIGELSAQAILANTEVNSVAVHDGIVALAVQAPVKTDNGFVAFFNAKDLSYISHVEVGALPDMLSFSPDGKMVVVANEGEPVAGYQVDPEGSVAIIDIANLSKPTVRIADFKAFNTQKAQLQAKGVRIYGPNATVAQDLEPEYVTISADSKTAWATLQENNAIAEIDLVRGQVVDIYALGTKHYGNVENATDLSDSDGKINMQTWPGVYGVYQPDAIASYQVNGQTYLVTANEGDAREWISDEAAYYTGDISKGFMEEFRVKHLIHDKGFARRSGDDLPAHLAALGTGARLDPTVFAYCGATLTSAGDCAKDEQLGRLKIMWNMGYKVDANGQAIKDVAGNLVYDKLYSFGARSFSIWDAKGQQVWDSANMLEKHVAEALPEFFNSNHEESKFDDRSDDKGPEPEGLALGKIGSKTFAFVGLERVGGVMVYDISQPTAPSFVQYINQRNFKAASLKDAGDLGPEGLHFVAAKDSPNQKPLLIVGNEVSGTTTIYQINFK